MFLTVPFTMLRNKKFVGNTASDRQMIFSNLVLMKTSLDTPVLHANEVMAEVDLALAEIIFEI